MDVQQALKRVVKAATVVGGVSRGLHEAAKVLDKYVSVLKPIDSICFLLSVSRKVASRLKQRACYIDAS